MIAEEPIYSDKPDSSIKPGTTINYILNSIKTASKLFITARDHPDIIKPLNENKLAQILVQLIGAQIKSHPFLAINSQFADMYESQATGIPDFYFYKTEEARAHKPIFVVEAKRLPSPTFATEYVKGERQNGGIERFKIEKHAKGFTNCGLVGFIEKDKPSHWLKTINGWIEGLANSDTTWSKDEMLREIESKTEYVYLKSTVRINSTEKKLSLHHLWIL